MTRDIKWKFEELRDIDESIFQFNQLYSEIFFDFLKSENHRHMLSVFGFFLLFLVCFEISYKNVKMRNSEAKRVHNISHYISQFSSSSNNFIILLLTNLYKEESWFHSLFLPQWDVFCRIHVLIRCSIELWIHVIMKRETQSG